MAEDAGNIHVRGQPVAPDPSLRFAQARVRLEAIAAREREDPLVDPRNLTRWWLHDEPVDRVVIAFHGYTNSPRQYDALGPLLFAEGYNVIAPRFPYHGYRDRLTTDIARMRFADWAATAIESVVIAFDAGARVVTLGISVGASVAAWLAATLPIELAVALSPSVAVRYLAEPANQLLTAALGALPDAFLWWDPVHRADQLPLHAYPRFSLHTLASTMDFGAVGAFDGRPGRRVVLLLNEHDPIVNNAVARERLGRLTKRGVIVEVDCRRDFPPRHDVIEPTLPGAPDRVVYDAITATIRRFAPAHAAPS